MCVCGGERGGGRELTVAEQDDAATDKLKPNLLNGANMPTYVWGQTLRDLEVGCRHGGAGAGGA